MQNLSAVIITKNEADRIGRCIQSLEGLASDVVVVDSGSSDDTIKIAKELGARVIETEWLGYGPTKNFGNAHAKHDWILSIDSDEYVTDDLKTEILRLNLSEPEVYTIDRQNYYLGQKIKHSGWSPDWVQRIFHKESVEWNDSLVHERLLIPTDHKVLKIKGKLNHDSYRSKEDHISKIDKYARLKAESWVKNGKSPSSMKRLMGGTFKAFQSYVLKLGFLDGSAGLELARMNHYLVKKQLDWYENLKSNTK